MSLSTFFHQLTFEGKSYSIGITTEMPVDKEKHHKYRGAKVKLFITCDNPILVEITAGVNVAIKSN